MPCSRSRISAAPVRMTVSIVIWLMTWVIAENHAVLRFGLKAARTHEIDRRAVRVSPPGDEPLDLGRDGVAQRTCAVAGLGDRCRVNIDLDAGLALGANVGLEIRRDFDDEQELALVHHRVDVGSGDLHRRLEGRQPKPLGDLPRQVRPVLVDDADREIGRFRHRAGGDRVHRNAERVDDQNQHHRVRPDASQFLDDQMEDVDHMVDEGQGLRFDEMRRFGRGSLRHLTPPACEAGPTKWPRRQGR